LPNQVQPIEIRTVLTSEEGTLAEYFEEYPTLTEALDLISGLTDIAIRQYGLANVEWANVERLAYVKPNGVTVTVYIRHDTHRYEVIS
jgi:hypothetical protein